jgi:hypothetical protein
VTYEYGEPRRNDIDRRNIPIRPQELSGNPTSNHLVAKQDELAMEIMKYLFHSSKGSLTCRKILRHQADGFTSPPKEAVLRIFIAIKNLSPLGGFNLRTLGSMVSTH